MTMTVQERIERQLGACLLRIMQLEQEVEELTKRIERDYKDVPQPYMKTD